MKQSIFLVTLGVLFEVTASLARSIYPMGKTVSGFATWYKADGYSGTCSLDMPVTYIGTAMSSSQWFGANICGACLQVRGVNGTTKVIVSNMCPNCGPNHLDLDPIAFAKLAPTKQGLIKPVH